VVLPVEVSVKVVVAKAEGGEETEVGVVREVRLESLQGVVSTARNTAEGGGRILTLSSPPSI